MGLLARADTRINFGDVDRAAGEDVALLNQLIEEPGVAELPVKMIEDD